MAGTGSGSRAGEGRFGREDGERGAKLLPGREGHGRTLQPCTSPEPWTWWVVNVANTEMGEGLKSRVRRGAEDGQTFLLSECTEAGSSGILLRIISDTEFPGHGDPLDSRMSENPRMSMPHSEEKLRFRARRLGFGCPVLSLTCYFLVTLGSDQRNASSW